MYKVLIVDDESIIVEGLKTVIPWDNLNCRVIDVAVNGEEGLELAKRIKPDILISDIKMPIKNGLEMVTELRKLFPNIQIIMITGFRNFEYAQEAVKLGIVRLLLKPTKMKELLEAINACINNLDGIETEDIPIENNTNNRLVDDILEYLKTNYNKKPTLQSVADNFYISSWHLCKLLKKATSKNFVEILNTIRIERAKELLTTTNMKIYEIADECGFSELTYFSNIFKKMTNKSPNAYRNSGQDGE